MKEKTTSLPSSPVTRQARRQGADVPPAQKSPLLIQTSFRHMPAAPAITARIAAEAAKLQRYFDGITHCHVVVVAPHRHLRTGRRYALHIELGVPRERLVIAHEPAPRPGRDAAARPTKSDEVDAAHKDIQVAVRDAFAAARRQLKDYVRRLRGE